jgi:hypothetical protein
MSIWRPSAQTRSDADYKAATPSPVPRGKRLFTVEHEVRSATHPMFMRPIVNRNPALNNRNYAFGHDQSLWAMAPEQ